MRFRWNDKPKTPKPPKSPRPPRPAAEAPARDSVSEYKSWSASGLALDEARAAQVNDPLSNPDTVGHLRKRARETSLAEIDAHHAHRMHELKTADRWRRVDTEAAESQIDYRIRQRDRAIDRIQRIEAARAAHDPATAAADEVGASTRRVRRYLIVAWVMSGLASAGIAASMWLSGWSLAMSIGTGVAAEIGLTYLASSIIADQSALSRCVGLARDAEGTRIDVELPRWTRILPWAAVGGLLTASISVNVYGLAVVGTGELGYLGAVAAVVAALATLLAWSHAQQSSAIVIALLSDSSIQAGEAALDEIASGAHIPRNTATVDRDAVLDAVAADPSLMDAVLREAAERVTAEISRPQPPVIPAPRPPADTTEVETDTGDRGGVALAEREGLAEGARLAANEAIANRNRIIAARLELINEGNTEPSVSAIAARAGVSRRTVNRHLGN